MNMRSAGNLLRTAGYGAGLGGLVLMLLGRRSYPPIRAYSAAGGILLVAMFILFLAGNVLYFAGRRTRPGRQDRRG